MVAHSKFSALGEVLICGDLNARTACMDDRCDSVDMQEWEGLGAANLPIPCDTINVHACARAVPPRHNADGLCNPNGKN